MPIKSLCNMWLSNDLPALWAMALNHIIIPASKADTNPSNTHRKRINLAVSLGHSGLMSQMLLSDGVAPLNDRPNILLALLL